MKYGNSPQHSTDSQRQTYTRKQHGKKVSPKEHTSIYLASSTHTLTHTSSLDRMYQIYSPSHRCYGRGGKEEKQKRKVCGCVDGGNGSHNTAISAIAAAATTTPLPIALWIARGQRIIIRIIILLLYISIDVCVSVSKTEHTVNKMNTEKCEKYVFFLCSSFYCCYCCCRRCCSSDNKNMWYRKGHLSISLFDFVFDCIRG